MGLGRVKTKSDLVVTPSGRQIFAFFCSPRDRRAQNSGWRKLRDFPGTVNQMAQLGVPTPLPAAAVATFMELPVAFAIAIGAFTRPAAVLMFFYTLGTALIGHRYWTMTGADRVDSMDSFYKNLSIMGGFSLLYTTGAGKYSIDRLFSIATP